MISDNVRLIRARISQACIRSGRAECDVAVAAVVKGRSCQEIRQALAEQISVIAENRVQEARAHSEQLRAEPAELEAVRWHMVGHLQTNKVREAVRLFDVIHSVDSRHLAAEIDTQAQRIGKVQDVLIEVKTSEEETKSGVLPQQLPELAGFIAGLQNVRLRGLMTMAPAVDDPGKARPYFRQLRQLRDDLNSVHGTPYPVHELSMGMSDDFEVAVEEGATIVRIGRSIFQSLP